MKIFWILFTFLIHCAQAFVLEDLSPSEREEILTNKKVGFYIGSFDPIHLGHQETVRLALNHGKCDYVLIYPAWGGDTYKIRADVNLRLEMLFALYAKDPHVIVTKLPPIKLQKCLTLPDQQRKINNKPTVQPAFKGLQFMGILGSDVALDLSKNAEALTPFMQGIQIPEKYYYHTIGGIISLPVSQFIVSQRQGDDLSGLHNKVGDRPIVAILHGQSTQVFSSTTVKKILQKGLSLQEFINPEVEKIIQKHHLYQ